MSDFVLRKSEPEDVYGLALDMRAEDRIEVAASGGFPPLQAVLTAYHHSAECWTALLEGQVAAMWGVAPLPGPAGRGVIWLLGGEAISRNPYGFLRASRREVARLRSAWSFLVNAADARYTVALRWLEWLGFEVEAPAPFGVAGLPFHRFSMGAACR